MSESEAEGLGCYETMSPRLVPLNRVLRQRDALCELCGEILATLKVPGNQDEKIEKLNKLCLSKWEKEFSQHSGEVDSPEKRYREAFETWCGHAKSAWEDRNMLDAAITKFLKDGDKDELRRVQETIPCGG